MATWSNYLREYETPGEELEPADALTVLRAVEGIAAANRKVRAVGSGHSSAEVAKPVAHEHWVDVRKLRSRDRPLEWPYHRGPADHYVRLGAGTTVREANALLADQSPPLALYNMGNYDGQTLAGVISTGTHGSGLLHGPICDRVVAIEMVTDERHGGQRKQRLLRIEPSNGITNRKRFEEEHGTYGGADRSIREMVLEQNDEVFDAALISLGCFGVIVALTFEVRDGFWLEEVETLETWPAASVKAMAEASPEFLQLTLEPHRIREAGPYHGEAVFVRTTRWEASARSGRPPERNRFLEDVARVIGWLDTGFLEDYGLEQPERALARVLSAFEQRRKNTFTSRSDIVHINSLGPHVKATSCDIWVPLDKADAAIERILELANDKPLSNRWEHDGWFHTSPVGIRVVGQSRALIAPSFDGPCASFELPLLHDVHEPAAKMQAHEAYRSRMLATLERELCMPEIGGRPHWGQRNRLDDARAKAIYGERWTSWKDTYARFNAFGTFDNAFTRRMGLSAGGGH